MRVDLFDFELPEDRIALRPAVPRESARLLTVSGAGRFSDRTVGDLPSLLDPSDILVFNDTRVVPARLSGIRRRAPSASGEGIARVEATLHLREAPDAWRAFMRPAKRLRPGDRLEFERGTSSLGAEVIEKSESGEVVLRFDRSAGDLDAAVALVGEMPLPPYIATRRSGEATDEADYQTIYAREAGAVAAPTAGLHFTPELMARLRDRGIAMEFLTLHVGAGTFLPVKAEDTSNHRMHTEIGRIPPDVAARLTGARRDGRRIVSVGTTSLRLLESAADEDGTIRPYSGPTDIFITPGYRFRAVDRLLTNFHLPRSTLFMLVSAFSGLETMKAAYRHAIGRHYRFYSYGDTCLLDRAER